MINLCPRKTIYLRYIIVWPCLYRRPHFGEVIGPAPSITQMLPHPLKKIKWKWKSSYATGVWEMSYGSRFKKARFYVNWEFTLLSKGLNYWLPHCPHIVLMNLLHWLCLLRQTALKTRSVWPTDICVIFEQSYDKSGTGSAIEPPSFP